MCPIILTYYSAVMFVGIISIPVDSQSPTGSDKVLLALGSSSVCTVTDLSRCYEKLAPGAISVMSLPVHLSIATTFSCLQAVPAFNPT